MEAESLLEMVVVANLLNGIVLDVQPFQIFRDEGVIEPLQAVRGDVEPLELALCRQQAVDIRYLEEEKKLSFNKKWRAQCPEQGGVPFRILRVEGVPTAASPEGGARPKAVKPSGYGSATYRGRGRGRPW